MVCNDHSGVPVWVKVPADLSHTGKTRWAWKGIDRCIAPLVKALNASGVLTVASCCGHGHRPGDIALADGRELIIAPDYESARRIDELFPLTSYGESKAEMRDAREGAE